MLVQQTLLIPSIFIGPELGFGIIIWSQIQEMICFQLYHIPFCIFVKKWTTSTGLQFGSWTTIRISSERNNLSQIISHSFSYFQRSGHWCLKSFKTVFFNTIYHPQSSEKYIGKAWEWKELLTWVQSTISFPTEHWFHIVYSFFLLIIAFATANTTARKIPIETKVALGNRDISTATVQLGPISNYISPGAAVSHVRSGLSLNWFHTDICSNSCKHELQHRCRSIPWWWNWSLHG